MAEILKKPKTKLKRKTKATIYWGGGEEAGRANGRTEEEGDEVGGGEGGGIGLER